MTPKRGRQPGQDEDGAENTKRGIEFRSLVSVSLSQQLRSDQEIHTRTIGAGLGDAEADSEPAVAVADDDVGVMV